MHEFTIGEQTYGSKPLDAKKQLHIVRRMAALLASLAAAAEDFGVTAAEGKLSLPKDAEGKLINPFASLSSVADVIAHMEDRDVDYVLDGLLAVVFRKADGGGWHPIMPGGANMFSLDLPTQLAIAWEVGKANLGSFMATFQSILGPKEATA